MKIERCFPAFAIDALSNGKVGHNCVPCVVTAGAPTKGEAGVVSRSNVCLSNQIRLPVFPYTLPGQPEILGPEAVDLPRAYISLG